MERNENLVMVPFGVQAKGVLLSGWGLDLNGGWCVAA